MSLYRYISTGEIREMDDAFFASRPPIKQALWESYTPPPPTQAELDAAAAEVARIAERDTLKQAIALFDSRTATNAQIQRAIAYILRNLV